MFRIAILYLAVIAAPTEAQVPDTILTSGHLIAQFRDARALAIDPGGTLYVVDADQDVVQIISSDGVDLARIGGPGSDHGLFDEPVDIDPTNGLVLVVADGQNGRIQRFTRAYLHTESLPVYQAHAFLDSATSGPGNGFPIAVATSSSNETFVIEGESGKVLKWDALRRPAGVLGDFGIGDAMLQDPVALAVNDQMVFVADAAASAIRVFDHFGGFTETLAQGAISGISTLLTTSSHLWVVKRESILALPLLDAPPFSLGVQLGEDLVDAGLFDGRLYLLTQTRLLVIEGLHSF